MAFHASLRSKLCQLQSSNIRFDADSTCFIVDGKRKRGLTKLLKALIPVPRSTKLTAAGVRESRSAPLGEHAQFTGSVMRRCGYCEDAVRYVRSRDSDECAISGRLAKERDRDRAHGLLVDYQIGVWVRHGRVGLFRREAIVDPCVGTLIEQLDALGWSVVGTQVPIYQASTDVATAIDLLATDRASRSQLHLIEIKASSAARQNVDNRENYERVRGVLARSILRDLNQSYYTLHQLQLLSMTDSVHERCNFKFTSACVMRVAPGSVVRYPLANSIAKRASDLRTALGLKTGKIKRKRAVAEYGVQKARVAKRARTKK